MGAIDRQVGVLASRQAAEERLKALKYVAHLVADVHQPLHASFADDRGGNSYQLQVSVSLHAVTSDLSFGTTDPFNVSPRVCRPSRRPRVRRRAAINQGFHEQLVGPKVVTGWSGRKQRCAN